MKLAAADAIFSVVADDLAPHRIVPSPFDPRVAPAVAAAVAAAAAAHPDAADGAVGAGASDRNGTLGVRGRTRAAGYGPWATPAMRCRPIGRIGRIVAAGRSLDE